MLTLLVGGARSGKSALAVELGRRHRGHVTFIATCPLLDEELAARVARHRAERPDWPTVEEPTELIRAIDHASDTLVIVDCLTLWVSNLMLRGDTDEHIVGEAAGVATAAAGRGAPTVIVSNEVGMGVHPETELGRRYRDLLGATNRLVAAEATATLLLVAGRAIRLDDPLAVLETAR